VLIAIAAHANGDGKAYPSLARIAALTGILRHHVPRSISRLEAAKLLRRVRHKGEHGGWDRNVYQVLFEQDTLLSRTNAPGELRRAAANGAANGFDAFWQAYPSRSPHDNPRKPAAAKFAALVKVGVDPEIIITGTKRYADYVNRDVRERRFVKQAITWLNQEQWTELYGPSSPPPLRAGMI
jgi:hypothetical protein